MTTVNLPLLGLPDDNNVAFQLAAMYERFGKGKPGRLCGACAHLYRVQAGASYLRCSRFRELNLIMPTSSRADFRAKWQACGKWEPED